MRLAATTLLCTCLLAAARTAQEKEEMQKAIRMKTSSQLKRIFEELGIEHKGLDKEGLRKKAYKENALARWEERHPEKKSPPRRASGGGMPDYGGKPPEGMDPQEWERLMAQMRGDFSFEKDPEKRRILEKLKRKGMSFGGASDMDIEQLRNMEKMMDGIQMGGMGDLPKTRDAPSPGDEDIPDDDKIEL
ncbi:hypothetical protein AB1Y20_004056 [Prymnesium parvum]|uniref:Uncharacterized protein n=1 Tax=Prymnesium parvum TaxID=97485 RepID=A0AB34J8V3_PRYPA